MPDTADQGLERARVLTKAVVNTANYLGIPQEKLADILGVSDSTVDGLYKESYRLAPEKAEWEYAVLLVRMYRSLDSIVGGSADDAKKWLVSENGAFEGRRPVELMVNAEGMARVVSYLDSYRAIV